MGVRGKEDVFKGVGGKACRFEILILLPFAKTLKN